MRRRAWPDLARAAALIAIRQVGDGVWRSGREIDVGIAAAASRAQRLRKTRVRRRMPVTTRIIARDGEVEEGIARAHMIARNNNRNVIAATTAVRASASLRTKTLTLTIRL
jgi:hypothetical protein